MNTAGPLIGLVLLLSACQISEDSTAKAPVPFKFKQLKLHQNDRSGKKLWDLQSPKASYRINQRIAYIEMPEGLLYRNGQSSYRITAKRGIIINDGEQIELINAVELTTLDNRKITLLAGRAIWKPAENIIDLIDKPQALDPTRTIRAGKARFHINREDLELKQSPRLLIWTKKQKAPELPQLDLLVRTANWNLISGKLSAAGPIKSLQRPQKDQQRFLTAVALEGNTKEEWLDFFPPVVITDPIKKMELKAGLSRWWIKQERITSLDYAEAKLDKLILKGSKLDLQERNHSIQVGANCVVIQPQQSLKADTCTWNWKTGSILADGAVELRRNQLNQVTRASQLQGKTGSDGLVVFTAPGERVATQLRLPQSKSPIKNQKPAIQF